MEKVFQVPKNHSCQHSTTTPSAIICYNRRGNKNFPSSCGGEGSKAKESMSTNQSIQRILEEVLWTEEKHTHIQEAKEEKK